MSVPVAPLQVCVFVSYFQGFANLNNTPNIGVYAMCDPTDAVSPGIRMRVERCTGAGCSSFVFIGNSDGVQFPLSPAPQAEYLDAGVYGTIYRYRVRFESNGGNGPYSAPLQIDTTTQNATACDTGVIEDFQDQVNTTGLREVVESALTEVRSTGLRENVEWGLTEVRTTGLRTVTEWTVPEVRATGLRIIIEYTVGPPIPPTPGGESQLIIWW